MKKAALVTGGAHRIGRAIALELACSGYDIALHYNSSKRQALKTARDVKNSDVRCLLFPCDFNKERDVFCLIEKVKRVFPCLNILINSASIFERRGFKDSDAELFNRTMNINLKTPFILSRDFARVFKKGHIINILDAKIATNQGAYFAYLLSKKAMAVFTTMAAKSLAPKIRVNGIALGPMLPPKGKNEEYLDAIVKKTPLAKRGETGHIISAVRFLIENEFVTGQILYVDGGQHLL